jgi:hypothetical protein
MPAFTRSLVRTTLMFLALVLLSSPFVSSAWAQTACTYSLGGCQCNCDGLAGVPPQSPTGRSFDSFVIKTYQGAYGRIPTCNERRAEFWNLQGESYSSTALLEEAKRFVSTRFETQQSYDIPGIDPSGYTQTTEYQNRNPSWQTDRVSIEAFVGDLYRAFLQRSPDPAGQCFWANNVCAEGRKKGIEAFKVSIEFGNLVNGLFEGTEPCPIIEPCRTGQICEQR